MGHVGEELRFRSVSELGGFSGSGVSLDGISQIEDHLVDFPLQFVHFSRGLDSDQLGEVSIGGSVRDITEGSDLSSQVHGHCVDI